MQDKECIFCKIAADELEAEVVFQDELVTAFRDINPVAPTHILIIPNQHIVNTNEVKLENEAEVARMLTVVPELARKEGVDESGYRLIMNTGPDGNQVVLHMHLHLIGGQKMMHPMG
jgi:histidine triad (HIT) family protein